MAWAVGQMNSWYSAWTEKAVTREWKCRSRVLLANNLLDFTQILNLSLDKQTIFDKSLEWKRPPMEDDLKILKVEYPSNHKLNHTLISKHLTI